MTDSAEDYPGASITSRSAFWALLLLVPAPSLGVLFGMWIVPGAVGSTAWGLSKIWLVAFPLLWWLRVDRGRLSFSPMRKGGVGVGLGSGALIAIAIVASYHLFGERLIDPATVREMAAKNNFDRKEVYLGLVIYLSFVNSLIEEYVWRWFVFIKCERLLKRWLAVIAAGVFFTIHHVLALAAQFGWEVTALASLGVFIGGATWSACYLRYRSVWPGYISHICADLAVFWVGWKILFGE